MATAHNAMKEFSSRERSHSPYMGGGQWQRGLGGWWWQRIVLGSTIKMRRWGGLFYSETRVLAETPLVGETPTKWEKSSDRCWPVLHMPYGEAVRSGKAGLIVTCYSHVLGVANSPHLTNHCLTPQ